MRKAALLVMLACLAACRSDMQDQPKYKPLRPSSFWPDGRSSRPVVSGTIARGMPPADSSKATLSQVARMSLTMPTCKAVL